MGRSTIHHNVVLALSVLAVAAAGARGEEAWATLAQRMKAADARSPQRLFDQADIFSESERQSLDAFLLRADEATQAPLFAVVIPSLEGGQIDDFASRLYEAAGLGAAKTEKGVLFLVAVQDRKMRIEVGYGSEGVITDSMAGRIIREVATPKFRAGDMAGGVREVCAVIAGRLAEAEDVELDGARPMPEGRDDGGGFSPFLLIILAWVLFSFVGWILRRLGLAPKRRRHRRGGGWIYFGGGGGGFGGGGGGGFGGGGFGGGFSGGGGASGGW